MAGYLGNNLLPARAGELVRTLLISTYSGLTKTFVLTTALTERAVDAMVLAGVGATLLATQRHVPDWLAGSARVGVVLAGVAAVTLLALPRVGGLVGTALQRGTGFKARLAVAAEQLVLGVQTLHHPARLTKFALLTASIWLLDATSTILGARALGLHFSYPVALLLLAGLGLGSALPSTPGYVGIYQFVAVNVLTPFGFSRSEALAYILTAQFFNYLVVGALGAAGLLRARPLLKRTL